MPTVLRKKNIIEPNLSYKIVGCLFDVYNYLGYGYSEVYYQRAIAKAFEDADIIFKREILIPVKFHNLNIGKQRCDFLVEDKVLVEIKKNKNFSKSNIEQVLDYLKASKLNLAILVNFSPGGIIFKRLINQDSFIRNNS